MRDVLELGGGQGRDALAFLRAGLNVIALDYEADAHSGTGVPHGDGMHEQGGFIVHFFDRALVDELAAGFRLLELVPFEEGELPRRLWRITLRKE